MSKIHTTALYFFVYMGGGIRDGVPSPNIGAGVIGGRRPWSRKICSVADLPILFYLFHVQVQPYDSLLKPLVL